MMIELLFMKDHFLLFTHDLYTTLHTILIIPHKILKTFISKKSTSKVTISKNIVVEILFDFRTAVTHKTQENQSR